MKSLDPKPNRDALREQIKNPPIIKPIVNPPGVRGKLPQLKTGEVILSPQEEKHLRELGWRPGMQLPGNVGEQVVRARQKIAHSIMNKKPKPDSFKPNIPTPVDIDTLDPEARERFEDYISDFQTKIPEIEQAIQANKNFSQLSPDVQTALQDAGVRGFEVVDSRGQTDSVQDKIDVAEGRRPADGLDDDDDDEDPRQPEEVAVPKEHLGSCPYCNWDLNQQLDAIDAGDKMVYLTAFMGGGLFHKAYSLFGKRVEMTFRELTSEQSEEVLTAVSEAVETNKIKPQFANRFGLQLRMMLSLISVSVGNITHKTEVTNSMSFDPVGVLASWRKQPVFHNETMWHTAQDTYRRFSDLLANLTARAHDENF